MFQHSVIWCISSCVYFCQYSLSMPACQSALQPWVSLGLPYNQFPPDVRFLSKIIFYRMGLLASCPTPILEDQDISLSLDSTL
jgi:hypothetical protein